MKLYIKQRIFSLGDKYDIYDVNENVIFDVKSELFTIGAKLHLYDRNGQELYYIRRRITFFLAKYEIYKKNMLCASISQEFTLFKSKLNVDSCYGNFTLNGDFFHMDYEIYKDGLYFGSVHKKWLSWGDSYELDIPEAENAGFFSALVIAIDNCMHNENNG
ncbi:MAG: hypothetical protein E7255_00130 [Lachnospiraceae bacterium]|jgi:uncharacterized protein YxjI|nr:hypothetical protein [Lachnospiraceae bacterium]